MVRESLAVWSAAFLFSALLALVWQTLVLPMMPSLHAGHGLMFNDAIVFHSEALAIAARIKASGWGAWTLIPSGEFTGNVGLLSAHYALFGPHPTVFIPIQAGFHALGATLLFAIGREITGSARSATPSAIAAALFTVQPSALVWYGQNHKDAFLIAGFLMIALALVRAGNRQRARERWATTGGLVIGGLGLVFSMRPHMLAVYAACTVGALAVAASISTLLRGRVAAFSALGMLAVCGVLLAAAAFAPRMHSFTTSEAPVAAKTESSATSAGGSPGSAAPSRTASGMFIPSAWSWKPSTLVPPLVDRALAQTAAIRVHFLEYGESIGAGSTIDADRRPDNLPAVLAYLPRAALAGLFAPFPNTWTDRVSLPRLVGAIETSLLYLLAPGVLLLFVFGGRPDPRVIALLGLAIAVVTILCFVSPNAGTLHRVRYGQAMLVSLVGLIGWHCAFSRWLAWRTASTGGTGGRRRADASDLSGLARSGLLVMGLSMIGYLGFLVRDLLLVHRTGFGDALDGFYITLAMVMFVVSTAVLPVSDAIAPRLQMLGPGAWTPWWRTVLARASIATTVLSLLTWGAAAGAGWVDAEGQHGAAPLLATLCVLIALAGPLVVSNALLNAAGRAGTAAAAQVVVPIVTVSAIALSDAADSVLAAAVGMVIGQILNLVIALYCVRGLLPPADRSARGDATLGGSLARNYASLVLTAAVLNAAVPMNLWFASGLGEGSASLWAVGTKLLQVVAALGISVLSSAFVPYIARLQSRGIGASARNDLFPSLIAVGSLAGLLCVAAAIYAAPLLAAASGASSAPGDLERVVDLAVVAGTQLPALACLLVLSKFAAASSRPWLGTEAAIVGLLVNLALAMALSPRHGLVGLGIAWAVATATAALWLLARSVRMGALDARRAGIVVLLGALPVGAAATLHARTPAALATAMLAAAVAYAALAAASRRAASG